MSVHSVLRAAANPVAALGVAIALVGGTGVATAATGGTFVLGRSNTASSRTGLANTAGTPLSLSAPAGYPPLAVNTDVKVARLNADELDGLTSAQLQRRVTGTCSGGAVSAVTSAGDVTCALVPSRVRAEPVRPAAGAPVTQVVASFDGVTLTAKCSYLAPASGTPQVLSELYVVAAGGGTAVDGFLTYVDATGVISEDAVSFTPSESPLLLAGTLALQGQRQRVRAEVTVVTPNQVRQVTVLVVADGRDLSDTAHPCHAVGVVV